MLRAAFVVFSAFAIFSAASVLSASVAVAAEDKVWDLAERIGSGNFIAGKDKSRVELCQECHGEQGNATGVGVPHLAGQYADYILKQLRNFKSGERKHPVMNPMAQGLAEKEMGDIAAYFGSNNPMQGNGVKESGIGWNLFNRGDMKRNIMACKSCHGEHGKGQISANDIFPTIGGQRKLYLREQLFNWRAGSRNNSPDKVMNVIASALSDDEIEALSDYISGL
ncbi:MAG: c-type cytochrome [Methylophilaceae bacterium]